MITRSTGRQFGAIFVSRSFLIRLMCVSLIMHLISCQVWHWIVGGNFLGVSLYQSSSLPYRMHSCGHCYQIGQASCSHGRSCNRAWYSRFGDDSSYVSVPSPHLFAFSLITRLSDYIVQGHRFNIFEEFGCSPSSVYTWPIFPILLLPPIIIGLFSATYSALTIIAFYKNNSQFNAVLSNNGNFTSNRFIRLMCLASIEILFNIPIASYGIYLQSLVPLNPYISWENVHDDFSRIDQVPSVIWRSNRGEEIALELSRWSLVFCAFVFFMFFGFADEARKNYRYAFESVAKRVGLSTSSSTTYGNGINSLDYGSEGCVECSLIMRCVLFRWHCFFFSNLYSRKSKAIGSSGKVRPVLPVFVHKEMLQRHDSMDSFNVSIGDVSGALVNNSPLSPSPEKKLDYYPDLSYGALSGKGATKVDIDSLRLSSFPSSAASLNSSASSITYPTPTLARQDSGIEISSVHRDSLYVEPINPPTSSNSSTSESSPRPLPQPTNDSAVWW